MVISVVLFAGAQLFMKQWWWLADLTISGELEGLFLPLLGVMKLLVGFLLAENKAGNHLVVWGGVWVVGSGKKNDGKWWCRRAAGGSK